jgi:hypothetical protein
MNVRFRGLQQHLPKLKVRVASLQLAEAHNSRDAILYRIHANLFRTAQAVKAYVKGAFGSGSVQYLEVPRIPFINYE